MLIALATVLLRPVVFLWRVYASSFSALLSTLELGSTTTATSPSTTPTATTADINFEYGKDEYETKRIEY